MMKEQIHQAIDQLVFFLMFQKYMRDAFILHYTITLIKKTFSKYQCGFCKGFSTQHALLAMIEKIKTACDKKKFYAAILTDLSKAFDCIYHDLFIAILNTYGFDRNALKLIYNYHSDRSQKNRVGYSFRSLDIIYVVPQESILGPLLFNIDLCDLFFEDYSCNFVNFGDDSLK